MNVFKILNDFFTKKIWTIREFVVLSSVVVFNPVIIVATEYIFGLQFLIGMIVGWVTLCAIKTKWEAVDE